MASLESKVFVVTGGASGMGLATARMLTKLKAKAVCIGDFNEQPFSAIEAELSAINPDTTILTTKLDVTSSASVQSWISGVVSKFGRLDGAVNAAGLPQAVSERKRDGSVISTESDETWRRILGVNLTGVFYSCREQIKVMRELPECPRSIVNISSLAGLLHGPDCYSYGVSKAGVTYLTQCIANEVLPIGIRVNTVSPCLTRTPMMTKFFTGAAQDAVSAGGFTIVEPEEIAEAIIWLLSEASSKVSGINMPVGPGAP